MRQPFKTASFGHFISSFHNNVYKNKYTWFAWEQVFFLFNTNFVLLFTLILIIRLSNGTTTLCVNPGLYSFFFLYGKDLTFLHFIILLIFHKFSLSEVTLFKTCQILDTVHLRIRFQTLIWHIVWVYPFRPTQSLFVPTFILFCIIVYEIQNIIFPKIKIVNECKFFKHTT